MGQPASRVGDLHTCPLADPKPHVGGPVLPPGEPTVLIGNLPAARAGDKAVCVGPLDSISQGEATVLIGGNQAARLGDPTVHGGVLVVGCMTVLIGKSRVGDCMASAGQDGAAFIDVGDAA